MTFLFTTINAFSRYCVYKRSVGTGEGLAARGHQVYIIAFDCKENRLRLQKEAPHCQPVFYHGGVLREIITKIVRIWRIRPDVFFDPSAYTIRNLGFLRWLLPRRMKTIVEFSELYSEFTKQHRCWRILENAACRENGYLLCASRYLRDEIENRCRKLGIRRKLIYSPYAYPSYLCATPRKADMYKRIVYMGKISYGYGFKELLQAFARVAATRSDVLLEVSGIGSEFEKAKVWAQEQGLGERIVFYGYVAEEQLNARLGSADVFVLPLHDTVQDKARCPSKIFYYLPYSKPIVTCALGNPFDVLGEYGFYYRPGDIADMVRVLLAALETSQTFSYPQSILEENTWDARARQLEEWLTEEN